MIDRFVSIGLTQQALEQIHQLANLIYHARIDEALAFIRQLPDPYYRAVTLTELATKVASSDASSGA